MNLKLVAATVFGLVPTLSSANTWTCDLSEILGGTRQSLGAFEVSEASPTQVEYANYRVDCTVSSEIECTVLHLGSNFAAHSRSSPLASSFEIGFAQADAAFQAQLSCTSAHRETSFVDPFGSKTWYYIGRVNKSLAKATCEAAGLNFPSAAELSLIRHSFMNSSAGEALLAEVRDERYRYAWVNHVDSENNETIFIINMHSGSVVFQHPYDSHGTTPMPLICFR